MLCLQIYVSLVPQSGRKRRGRQGPLSANNGHSIPIRRYLMVISYL